MAKSKSKRTVQENLAIIHEWRETQAFILANIPIGEDGKPLPNPAADAFYIAFLNAAKELQ